MNLSKRQFFGAAAGGAIAGPSIAKSLVQEVASGGNLQSATIPWKGGTNGPMVADPDWAQRRLKEVILNRQRLKDEKAFEGLQLRLDEQHIAGHFDSMRSVSMNARRVMFNARKIELRRERELQWLDSEIENLKQQIGPLAALVFP